MLTLILKQENDICKQLKAAYQETLWLF
jgi:hypothetical protein